MQNSCIVYIPFFVIFLIFRKNLGILLGLFLIFGFFGFFYSIVLFIKIKLIARSKA
ncbi:unknown; predicted coding region [Mycoplasmopsis pulmonis]|uniref:Uncharacterized protein n=1 Tax=Mycoplasmopsis pulmonis (strain UAB CTIP) TaxID=272635 RepID=Q98QZ5_MYCPU|nr:unknown; predicted coding region [Mycoplasmopsis pulmonis]